MRKLFCVIVTGTVIGVGGTASGQNREDQALVELFVVEQAGAVVELHDAVDVWEPNAVEKKLTLSLGDDGTTVSRSFHIDSAAPEDAHIEIEDWIEKTTRVAPLYFDPGMAKYYPDAGCNAGMAGATATEVTTYNTPSGHCWVETSTFMCAKFGNFNLEIFNFDLYAWQPQNTTSSNC